MHVVLVAAVTERDVEHLVGAEEDRAAVVVAVGLEHLHDAQLAVHVDDAPTVALDDRVARDDRLSGALALAAGLRLLASVNLFGPIGPDVAVVGVGRVELKAEQALLPVVRQHLLAQIQEDLSIARGAVAGHSVDVARLAYHERGLGLARVVGDEQRLLERLLARKRVDVADGGTGLGRVRLCGGRAAERGGEEGEAKSG